MGKSTHVKHYVANLLFKSEIVPVMLELRSVDFKQELEDVILSELGFNKDESYLSIVSALLNAKKITLILDGYDEIKSEDSFLASKNISNFIKRFPGTSVVLTSRPECILPDIGKAKVVAFEELSRKQVQSLLYKYDRFVSGNYGKNLFAEIDNVPDIFLENPLLVSLLYRTYAINGTVAGDISVFYSDLYTALYQGHDIRTKSSYVREKKSNLSISEFRDVFRAISYVSIVSDRYFLGDKAASICHIERSSKLIDNIEYSSQSFFEDLTVAVPLLVREGDEYKYLHKTISEYFAAEYIIYSERRDDIMLKIANNRQSSRMSGVSKFVLDVAPELFEKATLRPCANSIVDANFGAQIEVRILATLFYQYDIDVLLTFAGAEYDLGDDIGTDGGTIFLDQSLRANSMSGEFELDGAKFKLILVANTKQPKVPYDLVRKISTIENCDTFKSKISNTKLPLEIPCDEIVNLSLENVSGLSRYKLVLDTAIDLLAHLQTSTRANVSLICSKRALSYLDELNTKAQFEDELLSTTTT